jgi:hypothetical protein
MLSPTSRGIVEKGIPENTTSGSLSPCDLSAPAMSAALP